MQVTHRAFTEIDLATAPAFLAEMREAIDGAEGRVVEIDCSEITFMDSSGFYALRSAHDYATARDHTLVIRGLTEHCRRVVRLCDTKHALTIES